MDYIRNVVNDPNVTSAYDEKFLSMIALKMMKYVYEKHNDGERRQEYEDYFQSEDKIFRALLPEEEILLKKVINHFDKHFEEYKSVPCFEILKNFKNNKKQAPEKYLDDQNEMHTFDLKSYLELLSNKDGSIKSANELKNLPKEEVLKLNSSIVKFADIADSCAIKSGSGFGMQMGR